MAPQIDTIEHVVAVAPAFKPRPWTRDEWASFLDGWSYQRLGYPRDDGPFFVAGFEAAALARKAAA